MSSSDTEGWETIGKRKIQYRRTIDGEIITTTYGISGTSWLIKIQNGDTVRWSVCCDAWEIDKPQAAMRNLQSMCDSEETRLRWFAVRQIKLRPETFYGADECSDGKFLCDILLDAIKTGNRHPLDELAKVIEGVHKSHEEDSKRWKIATAIKKAARRLGRVPTPSEALQDYMDEGGDGDEGNFSRGVKSAGFGWIAGGGCKGS